MAINRLFISYNNYDFTALASVEHTALLREKNLANALASTKSEDWHSSLEDLGIGLDQWSVVLDQANEIILIDLDETFVKKIDDSACYLYLNFFKALTKYRAKTKNFDWIDNFKNQLVNSSTRPNDNKLLWITGCSVTAGVGVDEDQRYADIIANNLGLEKVMLARSGSSITWQSDQLLQSDIRENDVVIWGLTNFQRIDYAEGLDWLSIPASNLEFKNHFWKYWKYDYFDSYTHSVTCIKSILHVINFCKKAKAKLILVNLIEDSWCSFLFTKNDNYIDLTRVFDQDGRYGFIDYGWDNDHPGPKQHQEYARQILNFIEETNHGKTV